MGEGQKYHCGASKWPKWVRKLASKIFNASCKVHDLDYGKDTPYLQYEADERFIQHMKRQLEKRKRFKWLYSMKAKFYFWAVSTYGKKQYDGDEVAIMKKREEEEQQQQDVA